MKYDQEEIESDKKKKKWNFLKESKLYESYLNIKQRLLLKRDQKDEQKKTSLLSILGVKKVLESTS
jgi:hypothetical protein